MVEHSLIVDLKLFLSVEVEDEGEAKLDRVVTEKVSSALLRETSFTRVCVLPGSALTTNDNQPVANGPAVAPPQPEPKLEPKRVLGRDLETKPVPGGMYEFVLPGFGPVCRAPSNHPDWMNAIANAINAGRKTA